MATHHFDVIQPSSNIHYLSVLLGITKVKVPEQSQLGAVVSVYRRRANDVPVDSASGDGVKNTTVR